MTRNCCNFLIECCNLFSLRCIQTSNLFLQALLHSFQTSLIIGMLSPVIIKAFLSLLSI